MVDYSNFTSHGYEITKQLNINNQGGRITYKAIQKSSNQPVIIKQFKFISSKSDWSGFKAIEKELEILKKLDHEGIPKYLDSFESENGICLVQEYKDAINLSKKLELNLNEIKEIAVSVLNILVYLQKQKPPVFHRDIKPENILIDQDLNSYLVDFGLAKIASEELTSTTTVSGTMGFMPPEQLLNHSLSKASDLYSLGITLIALIAGKPSSQVSKFINSQFQVDLSVIESKVAPEFLSWLKKLVKPNANERYPDAETALNKLQPLAIKPRSEIELSHLTIELEANQIGEELETAFNINDSISETITEGKWEVAPHQSDPPHTPDRHAWITFEPANFTQQQDKEIVCNIRVDTSQLKANQAFQRKLLLHDQSHLKTYAIPIRVKTAPIPLSFAPFPNYGVLILLFVVGAITALIYKFDYLGSLAFNQIIETIKLVESDPHYNCMTNLGILGGAIWGIFLAFSSWFAIWEVQSKDQNQSDQNQSDQNQSEQNQSEQSQSEQNQSEQSQSEQSQSEQSQSKQNQSDQNQSDQNQSEQSQSKQNQSEQNQSSNGFESFEEGLGLTILGLPMLALLYIIVMTSIAILMHIVWTTLILFQLPTLESLVDLGSLNLYVFTDVTFLFTVIGFTFGAFIHFYMSLVKAGLNYMFAMVFILCSIALSATGAIAIVKQSSGLLSLAIAGCSTIYLLAVYAYLPWAKHREKKQFKQKEKHLISP